MQTSQHTKNMPICLQLPAEAPFSSKEWQGNYLASGPGEEGDSLGAAHAQQGASCEALRAAAQLQGGGLLEVAEQLDCAAAFPAQSRRHWSLPFQLRRHCLGLVCKSGGWALTPCSTTRHNAGRFAVTEGNPVWYSPPELVLNAARGPAAC